MLTQLGIEEKMPLSWWEAGRSHAGRGQRRELSGRQHQRGGSFQSPRCFSPTVSGIKLKIEQAYQDTRTKMSKKNNKKGKKTQITEIDSGWPQFFRNSDCCGQET